MSRENPSSAAGGSGSGSGTGTGSGVNPQQQASSSSSQTDGLGKGKGKGKGLSSDSTLIPNTATASNKPSDTNSAAGSGSSSLLSSLLPNGNRGVGDELRDLMAAQGKAGSGIGSSSIGMGGRSGGVLDDAISGSSVPSGGVGGSRAMEIGSAGPRQGFRTGTTTTSTSTGADSTGYEQTGISSSLSRSPPEPQYGSYEALNAGLHDLVRRFGTSETSSQRGQDSSAAPLSFNPELLDPEYHQVWARGVPDVSAATGYNSNAEELEVGSTDSHPRQRMEEAWNDARGSGTRDEVEKWWPTSSSKPPTAEEGGFMALLAAEEAQEAASSSTAAPATKSEEAGPSLLDLQLSLSNRQAELSEHEAYEPPPEPQHVLQSTDPRAALQFIIDGGGADHSANGNTSAQKWRGELEDLRRRLDETAPSASSTSALSSMPTASSGTDRLSRTLFRLHQVRQIEKDLALLSSRAGYTSDLWGYELGPDQAGRQKSRKEKEEQGDDLLPALAGTDEAVREMEREEVQKREEELEERRKAAVRRLDGLRRHLGGVE